MKTLGVILLALVGGFVAGILVSEVIGVVGMLVFQQPLGIKYLPVYLALLFAGVALIAGLVRRGG